MKKNTILERLEKIRTAVGGWEATARELHLSRTQLFRLKSGEQKINDNHIKQIDALERKLGITKSPIELMLLRMLVDRMAMIHGHVDGDEDKFEDLTGYRSKDVLTSIHKKFPEVDEMRRLAGLYSEDMEAAINEAHASIKKIDALLEEIKTEQNSFRSLVYYTTQRVATGLLEQDPLLRAIEAYEAEKSQIS